MTPESPTTHPFPLEQLIENEYRSLRRSLGYLHGAVKDLPAYEDEYGLRRMSPSALNAVQGCLDDMHHSLIRIRALRDASPSQV